MWLSHAARAVLDGVPRVRTWVFPFPGRNAPPKRHWPQRFWQRVRAEAGLHGVRLHDLRHTVASHAVMSGVAVPVVSRLLEHSDLGMTLRYAHLAETDIEAAAERIGAAMARVMAAAGSSGSTHT